MQILAKSVEARYYQICGKEHIYPDDGYQGEYIKNIAQNIINQEGSNLKPGSNIFIERVVAGLIGEFRRVNFFIWHVFQWWLGRDSCSFGNNLFGLAI